MSRELVIHRHYTANGCSNSLQIICFIHLYNLPIKISPSLSKIIPVPLSFSFSLHNWLRKNTFIGSLFLCSRFEWCVIRVPWSDSLYHCCTPGTWDLYHLLTSIVSLLPSYGCPMKLIPEAIVKSVHFLCAVLDRFTAMTTQCTHSWQARALSLTSWHPSHSSSCPFFSAS